MFAFFRKSVDSIIADISAKIDDLEAAVGFHNTQSAAHHAAAQASDELALAAASEADRANRIAGKLKDLLA